MNYQNQFLMKKLKKINNFQRILYIWDAKANRKDARLKRLLNHTNYLKMKENSIYKLINNKMVLNEN